MTLDQLYEQRQRHQNNIAVAKAAILQIDAEIIKQTKAKVGQIYALTGKQHGTLRVDLGDGITVVADISKKVEWNSEILKGIASTMNWEEAAAMFKIEFSLPENTYKTLVGDFKEAVDKARTVKYGEVKVELEKK